MRNELEGQFAAKGMALGHARVIYSASFDVEEEPLTHGGIPNEVKRFDEALKVARAELSALTDKLSGALARDMAEIIDAHAMILDDPEFTDGVVQLIRRETVRATTALRRQRDMLAAAFEAIEDPYLRARRDDLDHVVSRVFAALQRGGAEPERKPKAVDEILICETIAPADLAALVEQGLKGLVATASSPYSHTAILARSFGIPMVCGARAALNLVHDGDLVLLDSEHGLLLVNPDAIDLSRFRSHQREAEKEERRRAKQRVEDARTRDGHLINLYVNAEDTETIARARRNGAAGVGLFRTEFLFLRQRELPSEEEQFKVYRDAVIAMAGKPVTFRTLDLGADKAFGGPLEVAREENPALGLRGIRLSLQRKHLFIAQLRAILRASGFGPIRILLPMISAIEEVREARGLIEETMADLRRARVPLAEQIPLGVMIEVPAAALISNELARYAEFFAIGSNDLAQYVLAADRNNAQVSVAYDPMHPAFVRLLYLVADSARQAKRPLSVCGEIAGDPRYTALLIALGISDFSMHLNALNDVRDTAAKLSRKQLRGRLARVLHAGDREELQAALKHLS